MMSRHEVLVHLGPGGTMDIADRVLQLLEGQAAAVEYVLGQVELGGLHEVCTILGKDKATIGHWIAGRRSPDPLADPFPEPWVTLAATPVWDLRTVRAWGQSVGLSDLAVTSENRAVQNA